MGLNPWDGRFRRPPGPAVLLALLTGCAVGDADGGPSLTVAGLSTGAPVVEAHDLAGLPDFTGDWQRVLSVFVVPEGDPGELPPILGSYQVAGDVLRFTPRYGLSPGLTYRARLDASALEPGSGATQPVELQFSIPAESSEPTATVERVYPSSDVLPENLLRFYIHFSNPMGRGQAYDHVRLLDASGQEVEAAFLELGEELWDPTGTRFTMLFDPGRIKHGLLPREEVGPALVQGGMYTLEVDAGFRDADGLPMVQGFRKTFSVVEPITTRIDPAAWTIDPPQAGSRRPLVVRFARSLDHALAGRMLWVMDPDGQVVPGEVVIQEQETRWAFMPDADWSAGPHELVVDTTLEDVAGNTVQGPFEEDVPGTGAARLEVQTTSVRFAVDG